MLNDAQKAKAISIWNSYIDSDRKFLNASKQYTQDELDNQRRRIIPQVNQFIFDFIANKIDLNAFKSSIDSINKLHRLWGFKGISGQMYFNMLYNASTGAGQIDQLVSLLKDVLILPTDISQAKSKIQMISTYSDSLSELASDKRSAPRTGSSLFFISYFWQIQSPEKWPIYYKSMIEVLQDEGIFIPSGDRPADYEKFYDLNCYLKEIFRWKNETKEVALWDIEHACWKWNDRIEITKTTETPKKITAVTTLHGDELSELPASYLPPVISIIPQLSRNDESLRAACDKIGLSIERVFEQRISVLFSMLGYKVETLGQGHGRVPDGIAICSEFHYAIIYDAKARKDGYNLGTDDRAIREYIYKETEMLKRQGIRNVYFAVISSEFLGDFDDAIRNLKMDTDIREVLFVEAIALLSMLEQKLRNSELDLGPKGIQNIFAQSGVITKSDIDEFLMA